MTWWDEKKEEIFKDGLSNGQSLFVVDEPSNNDQFGFGHYVNSLEAIVRECKTPFVVGVLGKWGVGKTTLINKFLRKRLEEQENIGFVYFDAWKYQKNAFYRQFLRKMKSDLSISDDMLFVRLYKTIKKARKLDDLEWDKEEIKNLGMEITAWYVLWLILVFQFELPVSSLLHFILPLIPSVILGLVHRGTKLIRVREQEEEDKPLFSNEQFEEVFETYVDKALFERPNGKIVVVIDNLDRCTNEIALELLGTIKTFLNVQGCVYLVPVDEEALINHLKEGLLNAELSTMDRDKQSREFLKKFFQATIRLTPFIRGDLEKYIDEISSEIAIPYSTTTEKENVASMVLTAYSHTPRKIKQFYNNLSASYLLALAQEEQGNINKGLITNNLSFLAKLIILQEEWPEFFNYIKKDPELLNLTEGHTRGKELNSPHAEDIKNQLKSHQDLGDFLQSSRPYHSQDLEQFINLKREGYGAFADEASELSVSLLTGKAEPIIEVFNKGSDDAKKNLIKFIEDKLNDKQGQSKSAVVFNILSVIDEIFSVIPDDQKEKMADLFATYLAHNTQLTNAQEFAPEGLLDILSKVSNRQNESRHIIINEHVNKIDKNIEEVFEYLNSGYGKYVAIISSAAKKKLSETLEKAYNQSGEKGEPEGLYVADVLNSLSKISDYESALNEYLTPGLIDALIKNVKSIPHNSITKLQQENLGVLKKVAPILLDNKLKILLTDVHHVLHEVSGWGDGKEKIAEFSNQMVLEDMVRENLVDEVVGYYSDYLNSPNVAPTYRAELLPAIKKLSDAKNEAKQKFVEIIRFLISSQDIAQLVEFLKKVEEQKVGFRDKLMPALVNRIGNTPDKTQRESLFEVLEAFGALQGGQLYISSLKDVVITSTNFEITNHALSKLGNNRPSIKETHINEMCPKLLEWSVSLVNEPRRTTPFSFLVASFELLNEKNKEELVDAWSGILENSGEQIGVKNEIGGFIQDEKVLNNFPNTRRDGLPRKLLDIAKGANVDEKELLLKTLVATKLLYSRKTTFIKEIKEYATELQQNPEGSREHQIGKSILESLG